MMKKLSLFRSLSCIIAALVVNAVFIFRVLETDFQSGKHGKENFVPSRRDEVDKIAAGRRAAQSEHNILPTTKPTALKSIAIEKTNIPAAASAVPSKRNTFPAFGTREFNQSCGWTMETRPDIPVTARNCTILARPQPDQNEGISAWTAQVVSGFIMAKQTGCDFRTDYGAPGINISEFLVAPPALDWRVSPNFTCEAENHCLIAWVAYPRGGGPTFRTTHKFFLAAVPNYRNPYGSERAFEGENHFVGLKKTLGSTFNLESSMRCVFASLMQLAPSVANYQPDFFTTILPTIHDPRNALVLSIYIRTGHTEHIQIQEKIEENRKQAESIIECALYLEEDLIVDKKSNQRVVWMVVTDAPDLKTWITQSYSSQDDPQQIRQRTVLTTKSRGAHTKIRNNVPSTADFAEAFLDWYLIGESDVVVADHRAPSFGNTATFRTARPYYKVPKEGGRCNKVAHTYQW